MKKLFLVLFIGFSITVSGYAQVEILLDEPFTESLGAFTLDEQKYPGCT